METYQMVLTNSDIHHLVARSLQHNCTQELLQQGYIVKKNTSGLDTSHDAVAKQVIEISQQPQLLSCANLSQFKRGLFLGRGFTKSVYKSTYKGEEVAVKMITSDVEDIKACLERKLYYKKEECYLYANYKLLKEITLGLQLQHRNILKVSKSISPSYTSLYFYVSFQMLTK